MRTHTQYGFEIWIKPGKDKKRVRFAETKNSAVKTKQHNTRGELLITNRALMYREMRRALQCSAIPFRDSNLIYLRNRRRFI